MAIGATLLTSGSDTNNAAVSFTTASVTPTAGAVVYAAVATANSGANPTLSGVGAGWSLVTDGTTNADNDEVTLWRATGTLTPGTITIDAPVQDGCLWAVFEVTGQDTSSPVVDVTVASGTSASPSVTMPTPVAGSGTLAVFGIVNNTGSTPGSGYTELADVPMTGPTRGLMVEWRAGASTTANATAATSGDWDGIAVELRAAATGATQHPIAATVAATTSTTATTGLRAAASATVAAATAVAATVGAAYGLAATTPATSATSATVGARYGVTATVPATSGVSASLGVVGGPVSQPIAATIQAASTVAATLGARLSLAATVGATSGSSGDLGAVLPVAATVAATSSVSADVGVQSGAPVVPRAITVTPLPPAITTSALPAAISVTPLPHPIAVRSLPVTDYLRADDPDVVKDYTATVDPTRGDLDFTPSVIAKRGTTETAQAADWLDPVGTTRRLRVHLDGLAAGTYHLWLVVPGGADEYLGHATLL